MSQKESFGERLRKNAEKYLLEAATDDVASLYPGLSAKPYRKKGLVPFFWRKVFVPIYLMIPWNVRKKMILMSSYPSGKRPQWGRRG
ncbi:MAG: hypothetical protein L0Y68_01910 [Candidatus Dadabacteria bacterium]|nr:hypothetical protein [Candidatus Dadabacteria bacterium]